jgi:hypothetical protein
MDAPTSGKFSSHLLESGGERSAGALISRTQITSAILARSVLKLVLAWDLAPVVRGPV